MTVTKHKVIVMLCLQFALAISVQPFIFFQKAAFVIPGNTTFITKMLGHAKSQIGVQTAKKPLVERVPEHFFQALEAAVTRAFTIAMSQKETFSVDFRHIGIGMHLQTHLLG